jgi:hypothetical protein
MKMGKYHCGFCSTDTHQYCPGVIDQQDHGLYKCPCQCAWSTTHRCKVCDNRNIDEVDPQTWRCVDPQPCMQEVDRKRQAAKERLYPHGEPTTPTKKGKQCNCGCNESTSGGMFKPGHADKLVAGYAKDIKAKRMTRTEVEKHLYEISPGLLKKLENRL